MNRTLLYGFGGLLLLIAVSGLSAIRMLERLDQRQQAYRTQLMDRSQALHQVREAVYLSGTYARDYLFDPDHSAANALRDQLRALEVETETAMARCQPSDVLSSLHGEIKTYWKVLWLMLEVAQRERRRAVDSYFYGELVQRRTAMLSIADRAAILLDQENTAGQQNLASLTRDYRRQALAILVLIVIAGATLVAFVWRHLLHLEGEARRRRLDLEALSARLVTTQEDERKALARELHDEVGQTLTALNVEASHAIHALAAASAESRAHLESILDLTGRCVSSVRGMALSLRPSMLDDFGLIPALEWHAREVNKRTGLVVRLQADDSAADLPDEIRTCIYRIAQEALHNCGRHSMATVVTLNLQQSKLAVTLAIADDGRGFDASRTRGLGLLGMSERVERLGGRLDIQSQPGQGTRILIHLPLAVLQAAA